MRLTVSIASILLASPAWAETSIFALDVGKEYEITTVRESSKQSDAGSSGSTYDKDTIMQRIVGSHDGGIDLTYDFPRDTTADERRRTWQFPVRVFRPKRGPMLLQNKAELEKRIDSWLKAGNLPRSACGRWIFTWNAFRIECDPESVTKMLEAYDPIFVELRDGSPYQDPAAKAPAPLIKMAEAVFKVDLAVDPERARRARAESDVVVGEIIRKPVTIEAALRDRAKEIISGTISIIFDADSAGNFRRLTKITRLETVNAARQRETETITETMERRMVSSRPDGQ